LVSKGKVLKRFWNLKNYVSKFLEEKGELPKGCRILKEDECLWDLAYLTEIMEHLNNLNL
jgi:hypothetical protein